MLHLYKKKVPIRYSYKVQEIYLSHILAWKDQLYDEPISLASSTKDTSE